MELGGMCVGSYRGRVRGVGLNGDHISLYTSTKISENFTHAYNEIVKKATMMKSQFRDFRAL